MARHSRERGLPRAAPHGQRVSGRPPSEQQGPPEPHRNKGDLPPSNSALVSTPWTAPVLFSPNCCPPHFKHIQRDSGQDPRMGAVQLQHLLAPLQSPEALLGLRTLALYPLAMHRGWCPGSRSMHCGRASLQDFGTWAPLDGASGNAVGLPPPPPAARPLPSGRSTPAPALARRRGGVGEPSAPGTVASDCCLCSPRFTRALVSYRRRPPPEGQSRPVPTSSPHYLFSCAPAGPRTQMDSPSLGVWEGIFLPLWQPENPEGGQGGPALACRRVRPEPWTVYTHKGWRGSSNQRLSHERNLGLC